MGSGARIEWVGCAIAGNAATDAEGGGGLWLDAHAQLKAAGLTLAGNRVADTAGPLPMQLRVEAKATAEVQGEVDGGSDGIYVAKGGKASLNGAEVREHADPKQDSADGGGVVSESP